MRHPQVVKKKRQRRELRREKNRKSFFSFVSDIENIQDLTLEEFVSLSERYGYSPTFDLIKKYYPMPPFRKIRND
jgi:hypothetical protein